MQLFQLKDRDFKEIAAIVYNSAGIHLKESKRTLVVSRLTKRVRALGLDSFSEYVRYLSHPEHQAQELPQLVNCITTNTTEFFREPKHFDFLKKVLPPLLAQGETMGRRVLRVWCSACSTGEEAYSLAMVLANFFERCRGWKVRVLASDIDTDVLRFASAGIYPTERSRSIPVILRSKYMKMTPGLPPGHSQVARKLRTMVVFRKINLLHDAFRFNQPLDIIFCRNVVIYFDDPSKQKLVNKFAAVLRPGGYIFVGHSESLLIQKDNFRFVENTIYQRV